MKFFTKINKKDFALFDLNVDGKIENMKLITGKQRKRTKMT